MPILSDCVVVVVGLCFLTQCANEVPFDRYKHFKWLDKVSQLNLMPTPSTRSLQICDETYLSFAVSTLVSSN